MPTKVKEATAILESEGWTLVRLIAGLRHYRDPDGHRVVTVAGKPSSNLPVGTLASLRDASGIGSLQ